MDADAQRKHTRKRWAQSAPGWTRQRERWSRDTAPVSMHMVDVAALAPGHSVLELACGAGDVGLLAAELVRPGGTAILTDTSEEMLAIAEARASDLGFRDVECVPMDAEWIDRGAASLDAVLCRWGLMHVCDLGAALRECRRVLRPGGRLVAAAWSGPDENPWIAVARSVIDEALGGQPTLSQPVGGPGMFALGDAATFIERVYDAGFVEVAVDAVNLTARFDDVDDWWDALLDFSTAMYETLSVATPQQRDDIRDEADRRIAAWAQPDGRLEIPGRTHVFVAEA